MILLDLIALDIDPNVVKPGWTPLLITIGIALVMVGLFFSMRRQFRNINVDQTQPGAEPDEAGPPPQSSTTTTP